MLRDCYRLAYFTTAVLASFGGATFSPDYITLIRRLHVFKLNLPFLLLEFELVLESASIVAHKKRFHSFHPHIVDLLADSLAHELNGKSKIMSHDNKEVSTYAESLLDYFKR